MRYLNLFLIVTVLAWMTSCPVKKKTEESVHVPDPTPTGPAITDVNPKEAFELVSQQSDVIILDVRTPEEFSSGHIGGALNINIASDNFKDRLAEMKREKAYLVHCAAGAPNGRSRRSVALMEKLGFKKIYHLEGGFFGWRRAGYATETPEGKE